jgi:hypothetical protein
MEDLETNFVHPNAASMHASTSGRRSGGTATLT